MIHYRQADSNQGKTCRCCSAVSPTAVTHEHCLFSCSSLKPHYEQIPEQACVSGSEKTLPNALLGSAGAFGLIHGLPASLFSEDFPLCCKRFAEVLILLILACCVCRGINCEAIRLFADRFDVAFFFLRGKPGLSCSDSSC